MCRSARTPWRNQFGTPRFASADFSCRLSFPTRFPAVFVIGLLFFLGSAAHAQTGDVVISSDATWPAGQYNVNSLTVTNGATLTLQGANTTGQVDGQWQGYGVTITAANVQVDAGSAISADAQGYTGGATGAPGNGPGGGCGSAMYDSAGGSYGGVGYSYAGCSAGPIYGSALTPTDLGSGGGGTTTCAGGSCPGARVGGNGGGAIRLIVTGTLTNNGTISANGGNSAPNWPPSSLDAYAVGGSGGSIWATVGTLTGSGVFTANGGLRYWSELPVSGGGGGRIVVYYGVNDSFGGFNTSTVNGGPGAGQGTVAFFNTTENDLLVAGPHVFIYGEDSSLAFHDITVRDGATLIVGGGSTVNAGGTVSVTGNSSIILKGKNTTAEVGGQWVGQGVTFAAGTVQVDAGSAISADAQGYTGGATGAPGNGPGGGCGSAMYDSAGGSYGGVGYSYTGCSAGPIYGSALTPTDLGSGGGGTTTCAGGSCPGTRVGGNGGGAIRLIVTGTLTNNGTISANGGNGGPNSPPSLDAYAVGGSGGSIWATVGTLTGSGVFTANGGLRYWSELPVSGGGGGRIAVYYGVDSGFTGFNTSTANGGTGAEQGTITFINTTGNNLEVTGGQTFVIPQDANLTFHEVTVHNGARLIMGGGATLNATSTLSVSGNSTIIVQGKNTTGQVGDQWVGQGATITAATLRVDAGSAINADSQGYTGGATGAAGNGPGGGCGSAVYDSAGGSYGGVGYIYAGCSAGPTYGSAYAPADLGSGAGGATVSVGGNGGGAIRLIVTGTLTNDGTISANGGNGGTYSGGGSGGSIWATVGTLTGSGLFAANGGVRMWGGDPAYPGGGGGRIAVYYRSDGGFAGFNTSTVNGGPGAEAGTLHFIQLFHLTVAKAGTGTGTVTSDPAGIDCGSTCSADVNSATPVTLIATPATGSTFAGWSGDSDCSDGALTMTGNRNCVATFNLLTFPLTVTKTGPGTVTANVSGIDCGATCVASYNYNTQVTLTATADPGALFLGWSGEGCSGTGTCVVTMTQARSVTAAFLAPPGAAPLTSPTGTIGTNTPPYTWTAVPTATWYYLWVVDATGTKVQTWYAAASVGCAAGGTCSVTPSTLLAPGAATWWVQTWNSAGYGPWSSGLGFTVPALGVPPAVTTLTAPTGTIGGNTPPYTWTAVPTATWYCLWVNDASGSGKLTAVVPRHRPRLWGRDLQRDPEHPPRPGRLPPGGCRPGTARGTAPGAAGWASWCPRWGSPPR